MIMKETTTLPAYTASDFHEVTYEPKWGMTPLGWFNVAKCARARMAERCTNIHQWRGERISFYTALQMMQVDEVEFVDDDTYK
jgi:hypothetical protein